MKWKATNAQITDKGAVRIKASDALRSDEARTQLAAVAALRERDENEPVTYMDRGIELKITPAARSEELRKLAEFAYRLYLSHSADSGGT